MEGQNLEKTNTAKPFGKEAIKIQIKIYSRFLEHLDGILQKNQKQKFYYDIINADYSNGIQGLVDQKNNNAIAAYTLFSGNVAKIAEITEQFSYEANQDRLEHRNTPDVNVSDDSNLTVEKAYKAVRFDPHQAAHDLIEELVKSTEKELRSAEDMLKRLAEPVVDQAYTSLAEKAKKTEKEFEIDPVLFQDLYNKRKRYFKARIMRGRIANRTIGKLFGRLLNGDNGEKMVFGGAEGKANLEKLEREYNESLNNLYIDRLRHELNNLPGGSDRRAAFAISRELMVDHQRREQNLINKMVESGEFKTGWLDEKAHKWNSFWRSTSGNVSRALGGGAVAGVAGLLTVVASKYGARKGLLAMFGGATGGILNAIAGMYGTYILTEAVLERRGPTGMTQRGWVDENFDKVSPEEVENLDESIVLQEVARLREMQLVRGTKVEDAFVSGVRGKSREKRRKLAETLIKRERELRAQRAVDKVWSEDLIKNVIGKEQREHISYLVAHQALKEMRDRERHSIHETDNERTARIKRKVASIATGVTVGWLTGGFLSNHSSGDTPNTIVPDDENNNLELDQEPEPITVDENNSQEPEPEPDQEPELDQELDQEPESITIPNHEPLEVEIVKWMDFDGVSGYLQSDTFIESVGDLQDQIRELEPDQQVFYQELLDMDREELAQKLGGYRPENPDESLIIHPGDKLQLVKGNIQIVRTDGEVDVLYNAVNGGFSPESLNDEVFTDSLTPEEYVGTTGNGSESMSRSPLLAPHLQYMDADWDTSTLDGAAEQLAHYETDPEAYGVYHHNALTTWAERFIQDVENLKNYEGYINLLDENIKQMAAGSPSAWTDLQIQSLVDIGVVESAQDFDDLSIEGKQDVIAKAVDRSNALVEEVENHGLLRGASLGDSASEPAPNLAPPESTELRGVFNSEELLRQSGEFDKLNQLYQAQLADGKIVGEYGEHFAQRVGLLEDYLEKQQQLVDQVGKDQAIGRTWRDLATDLRSERDLLDSTRDSIKLESLYEKYDVSDYDDLKQAVSTRIDELEKLAELANNGEAIFSLKGLPEPEVGRTGW